MSDTPTPTPDSAALPQSEARPPLSIEWHAQSISGTKKPVNDDTWLVFSADKNGATHLEDKVHHSLKHHDLIFAVSDGMGGSHAGDVASELILQKLSQYIPKTLQQAAEGKHPEYFAYLEEAVQEVSTEINRIAAADPLKKGMGATLALAWFTPENLYLCNVGDSRLYIHRVSDAETQQLTQDHTFAWKSMHRGDINERQYRSHPRRAALYEVVGGGHKNVHPYLSSIPYSAGDQFLICSDGLVDGLWNKHIHSAFSQNYSNLPQLTEALLTRAINNDGSDDTTLIVLKVVESP